MIVANIRDCAKYSGIHPDFAAAFAFLQTLTPEQLPGPLSYENRTCTVIEVQKKAPKEEDGQLWLEAHRRYIDIHYILSGEEAFGYADIARLTEAAEYSAENDCLFYKGALSAITLRQGDLCIVYPEDAHAPSMPSGMHPTVKRIVVKIALE